MAAPKPEDDFASLVSAALSGNQKPQSQPQPQPQPTTTTTAAMTHPDPDFPAESFRLPPEAELEWLDRSVAAAAIYERDDSTKGTANPKAHHQHQQQPLHNGNNNNNNNHGSNRFSGPLKPRKSAILGLPKSLQRHSGYLGAPRKGKGTSTTIFPKKKGKGKGKLTPGGVEEPGSPKVSCFGKVKSERERCREEQMRMRREARELQREREEEEQEAPAPRTGGGGFWSCLLLGPLACCRGNPAVGSVTSVDEDGSDRRTPSSLSAASDKKKKKKKNKQQQQHNDDRKNPEQRTSSRDSFSNPFSVTDPSSPQSASTAEPPGLGGLKRFASGRRPSSWGGGEFEAHGESVVGGGGVHADASSGPVAPPRRSVS